MKNGFLGFVAWPYIVPAAPGGYAKGRLSQRERRPLALCFAAFYIAKGRLL